MARAVVYGCNTPSALLNDKHSVAHGETWLLSTPSRYASDKDQSFRMYVALPGASAACKEASTADIRVTVSDLFVYQGYLEDGPGFDLSKAKSSIPMANRADSTERTFRSPIARQLSAGVDDSSINAPTAGDFKVHPAGDFKVHPAGDDNDDGYSLSRQLSVQVSSTAAGAYIEGTDFNPHGFPNVPSRVSSSDGLIWRYTQDITLSSSPAKRTGGRPGCPTFFLELSLPSPNTSGKKGWQCPNDAPFVGEGQLFYKMIVHLPDGAEVNCATTPFALDTSDSGSRFAFVYVDTTDPAKGVGEWEGPLRSPILSFYSSLLELLWLLHVPPDKEKDWFLLLQHAYHFHWTHGLLLRAARQTARQVTGASQSLKGSAILKAMGIALDGLADHFTPLAVGEANERRGYECLLTVPAMIGQLLTMTRFEGSPLRAMEETSSGGQKARGGETAKQEKGDGASRATICRLPSKPWPKSIWKCFSSAVSSPSEASLIELTQLISQRGGEQWWVSGLEHMYHFARTGLLALSVGSIQREITDFNFHHTLHMMKVLGITQIQDPTWFTKFSPFSRVEKGTSNHAVMNLDLSVTVRALIRDHCEVIGGPMADDLLLRVVDALDEERVRTISRVEDSKHLLLRSGYCGEGDQHGVAIQELLEEAVSLDFSVCRLRGEVEALLTKRDTFEQAWPDTDTLPPAARHALETAMARVWGKSAKSATDVDGSNSLVSQRAFLWSEKSMFETVIKSWQRGFRDGSVQLTADGAEPSSAPRLSYPNGLYELPDGSLLFTERENHSVRRLTTAGRVETIIGEKGMGHQEGPVAVARLRKPTGFCQAASGVYVIDSENGQIVHIDEKLETVSCFLKGGLKQPTAMVAVNPECTKFVVADKGAHVLKLFDNRDPKAKITVVAGKAGNRGSVDGPPKFSRLDNPQTLLYDAAINGVYCIEEDGRLLALSLDTLEVVTLIGQERQPDHPTVLAKLDPTKEEMEELGDDGVAEGESQEIRLGRTFALGQCPSMAMAVKEGAEDDTRCIIIADTEKSCLWSVRVDKSKSGPPSSWTVCVEQMTRRERGASVGRRMDVSYINGPGALLVRDTGELVVTGVFESSIFQFSAPMDASRAARVIQRAYHTYRGVKGAEEACRNVRLMMTTYELGRKKTRSSIKEFAFERLLAGNFGKVKDIFTKCQLEGFYAASEAALKIQKQRPLSHESIAGLFLLAPTLSALKPLLTQRWGVHELGQCRHALGLRLKTYDWPVGGDQLYADIDALTAAGMAHGVDLVDVEVVNVVLRNQDLFMDISERSLPFVDYVLRYVETGAMSFSSKSFGRQSSLIQTTQASPCYRSVAQWLSRVNGIASLRIPFRDRLGRTLSWWTELIPSLPVNSFEPVIKWLVQVSLDDVSLGPLAQPFLIHCAAVAASCDRDKALPPLLRGVFFDTVRTAAAKSDTFVAVHALLPDHDHDQEEGCLCESQWVCLECKKWHRNKNVRDTECFKCGQKKPSEAGKRPLCPLLNKRVGMDDELQASLSRMEREVLYEGMLAAVYGLESRLRDKEMLSLQDQIAAHEKRKKKAEERRKNETEEQRKKREEMLRAKGIDPDADREEFKPRGTRGEMSMLRCLREDSFMWTRFLNFFFQEKRFRGKIAGGDELLKDLWGRVANIGAGCVEAFDEGKRLILTEEGSNQLISLVQKNIRDLSELSDYCWIGQWLSRDEMETAITNLDDLYAQVRKLKTISQKFFEDSDLSRSLGVVDSNWSTFTPKMTRAFLGVLADEEPHKHLPEHLVIEPIPQALYSRMDWLWFLMESPLFVQVWEEALVKITPTEDPESEAFYSSLDVATSLEAASEKWHLLHNSLKDRTALFSQVQHYMESLLKETEVKRLALSQSGTSVEAESDELMEVKKQICDDMSMFRHAHAVYVTQNDVMTVLSGTRAYILPKGHGDVDAAEELVRSFGQFVEKEGPWETFALSVLDTMCDYLNGIDQVLTRSSPRLMTLLAENVEFITWLATMKNDADFTSNIEMAMGKAEIECPIELWKEEPGEAGRPDESKLSMLMTARSFLHVFAYRDELIVDSYRALILVLGALESPDENTLTAIEICGGLLAPLMELLDDNSETSAVNKLVQILRVNQSAKWTCTNHPVRELGDGTTSKEDKTAGKIKGDEADLDDCVDLRYVVVKKSLSTCRYQTMSELLDFQSTLVLAKSNQRTAEVEEIVDRFISQLAWVRALNAALFELSHAGHFDYATYSKEYPVDCDPEVIRTDAANAKAELESWTMHVAFAREKHSFLNFFAMKQVSALVLCLNNKEQQRCPQRGASGVKGKKKVDGNSRGVLDAASLEAVDGKFALSPDTTCGASLYGSRHAIQEALCIMNPDLGFDIEVLDYFESCMRELWEENDSNEAKDVLSTIGRSLASASKSLLEWLRKESPTKLPASGGISRLRKVSVTGIEDCPWIVDVSTGVHMVCGSTTGNGVDHVLSVFARAGVIPEADQLLACQSETTWEDVLNFLFRWSMSDRTVDGGVPVPYCLAFPDLLSFELQQQTVSQIREWASKARAPLVIVPGVNSGQHIITQFAHRRVEQTPVTVPVLRRFGDAISNQWSKGGATAYVSRYPGAGKSFKVRLDAHALRQYAVNLPILGPINSRTLICHMRSQLSRAAAWQSLEGDEAETKSGVLLHVDLKDPVTESFAALLLDLVLFGRVVDPATGEGVYLSKKLVSLAIEAATPQVTRRVRMSGLLPRCICAPPGVDGRANCVGLHVEADILRVGMGADFDSSLNDGTTVVAGQRSNFDASIRLAYVCSALVIMEEKEGCFPHLFEASGPVDSELAYGLLSKYSGQSTQANYWSIWNFVNVMFWELQEMHHPDSPINCICMPDAASEHSQDTRMKAKIKGEVIKFLSKTAKEFATREMIAVEDPDRIVAVHAHQHSKVMFCGMWYRAPYDNDGEPVFRSSKYFLYYRALEKVWVMDDIIQPVGAVFSSSTTSDINSRWSTSPGWMESPTFRVEHASAGDGYQGKGVRVRGSVKRESGECEDGLYALQPPYDNIHDRPHYIMRNPRRHLFWSKAENAYQISPVCNDDEGAFAISQTGDMFGRWVVMPPDMKEGTLVIQFLTRAQMEMDIRPGTIAPAATGEGSGANNDAASDGGTTAADDNTHPDEDDYLNDAANDALEELPDEMLALPWSSSNHECLLFNNSTHVVHFLSLDPNLMRSEMHPSLLRHLQDNNVTVGEDLKSLNSRHHEILGALTNINRSREEAANLMGKHYCLTGDALVKMLAIFVRIRCGIPTVLMGECGCGKTYLISYLCAWLGVTLKVLDVHGGTTEDDILGVFKDAEDTLASGKADSVYIFLDEINTCAHMGLMTEAICNRSLHGVRFSENIQVLAALNPYRRRPDTGEEAPGLTFSLGAQTTPDPMAQLVYRVHPIPKTLETFIFDFGSLSETAEKTYIRSMVLAKQDLMEAVEYEISLITELMSLSQEYIREVEEEASAVSLRDVKRCVNLIVWFRRDMLKEKGDAKKRKRKVSLLATSCVLALAHVYVYRLGSRRSRERYWSRLRINVDFKNRQLAHLGWAPLGEMGTLEMMLQRTQQMFCSHLDVDDGIAMNEALMENLWVTITCVLNRIPVFLVGKPGTSKTLTMQVVASNLQGKLSPRVMWRRFPAIYVFQYQCSPMSSADSIQHQFQMAKNYQNYSPDSLTVLLLDEVGLAEHSPDMPLKVLHGMLVDPPIAIVGLSNWVLDPAKMNRAICLQRMEPTAADIQLTGVSIFESYEGGENADGGDQNASGSRWLKSLAHAYHEIYHAQQAKSVREFVGMRDYYSLVKLLRRKVMEGEGAGSITHQMLLNAVCRNFGGRPDDLDEYLSIFLRYCFGEETQLSELKNLVPSVTELIANNLDDFSSRHMMILTKGGSALPLMVECGLLNEVETTVLIGSEFQDDMTELQLIQQINQVKIAMASGTTICLLNHDNIYEALYDVLNQRYIVKTDDITGKTRRMLRLAIGSRSQLCPVEDTFRIIVIVEQEHAYNNLDLPLLNRFEKQLLCAEHLLQPNQKRILNKLEEWVESVKQEAGLSSLQSVFCCFHDGTIPSLALSVSSYSNERMSPQEVKKCFSRAKLLLSRVALPLAMMRSSLLQAAYSASTAVEELAEGEEEFVEVEGQEGGHTPPSSPDYYSTHANFASLLEVMTKDAAAVASTADVADKSSSTSLSVVFTYSPTSHLDSALQSAALKSLSILRLTEVSSEKQVVERMHSFLTDSGSSNTMIVQCDPAVCSTSIINHSRYLCSQEKKRCEETANPSLMETLRRKSVVFLIHLPPSVTHRTRFYPLDFYSSWRFYFIDDLRPENEIEEGWTDCSAEVSTFSLLSKSLHQLCEEGILDLDLLMDQTYQAALSQCTIPTVESVVENVEDYSCGARIAMVRQLLSDDDVRTVIRTAVQKVLNCNSSLNKDGLHTHVSLVMEGDVSAGSLRQSLVISSQIIVTQALAHVIRNLDANFNFDLLARGISSSGRPAKEIWMAFAFAKGFIDLENIGRTAILGNKRSQWAVNAMITNTGKNRTMVSRFPFSLRFINIFDDPVNKDTLATRFGDKALNVAQLTASCETLFGKDVVKTWDEFACGVHEDYLHDYVSQTAPIVPGLSFLLQLRLYTILFKLTSPDALSSPAAIHMCMWENERRLFYLSSLIGNSLLGDAVKNKITDKLEEVLAACDYEVDWKKRLGHADGAVLEVLVSSLWETLQECCKSTCDFGGPLTWVSQVASILPDVNGLRETLNAEDSAHFQRQWHGLQATSIYIQEVVAAIHSHGYLRTDSLVPNEIIEQLRQVTSTEATLSHIAKLVASVEALLTTAVADALARAESMDRNNESLLLMLTTEPKNKHKCIWGSEQMARKLHSLCEAFSRRLICEIHLDPIVFKAESKQLATLASLVNGCNSKAPLDVPFSSLVAGLKEGEKAGLSTRKAVLGAVLSVGNRDGMDRITPFVDALGDSILAYDGFQLLCEREEDLLQLLGEKVVDNVSESQVKTIIEDVEKLSPSLFASRSGLGTTRLAVAKSLAMARHVTYRYGQSVANAANAADLEMPNGLPKLFDSLVNKSKTEFREASKHMALKFMKLVGGVECLFETFHDPVVQKWLGVDVGSQPQSGVWRKVPDLYPHLYPETKDVYEVMCNAVRACVTSVGATSWLDEVLNNRGFYSARSRECLVMATFSQCADRSILNETGMLAYRKWLKTYVHYPEAVSVCEWIVNGMNWGPHRANISDQQILLMKQVIVHCIAVSLHRGTSFFHTLSWRPMELVNSFVYSMPDDEALIVIGALKDRVGWYRCRNGHPYSVGECTMPMQQSKCITCGVPIGGQNHVSVAGVKKVNENTLADPQKGYIKDAADSDNVIRAGSPISKLSVRIIRFFMHGLMKASFGIRGNKSDLTKFIGATHEVAKRHVDVVFEDWRRIGEISPSIGGNNLDLAVFLHWIVQTVTAKNLLKGNVRNYQERAEVENEFETAGPNFLRKHYYLLEALKEAGAQGGVVTFVRNAIGDASWLKVHEKEPEEDVSSPIDHILSRAFRVAQNSTFAHFRREFEADSASMRRFPLVSTLLREENKLGSVKYLADILEWHSILFEVFPPNTISRDEASKIKNQDVIDKLPAHRKDQARACMERFMEGFNSTLPEIERIFECQANPFIGKDGKIDLSGMGNEGVRMTEQTPITFSLPSLVQTSSEGVEAPGVCTLALLNYMQAANNELLAQMDGVQLPEGRFLPQTTHSTPADLVRRQLIQYDRERDLFPLIHEYAKQDLGYGEGGVVRYDFEGVEGVIKTWLLGKTEINLHTRHFLFAGEMRNTGKLNALQSRVAQVDLPSSLVDAVKREVDTDHKLARLRSLLEDCVSFLVSLGGNSVRDIDGDVLLCTFARDVLLVDETTWKTVSTSTVDQHVRLCQMRSLYMTLESMTAGDPLEDVRDKYKEGLGADMEHYLREHGPKFDASVILPVIRDFMTDQLTEDKWDGSAQLKMYLGFATEIDLEELPWFDLFPDDLQLKNTLETYRLLQSLQ